MKKIGLILLLAGVATLTYGQDTPVRKDNYPYWAISKGVQKMQFKDVTFAPAKVSVGDVAVTSSKGVNRIQAASTTDRTAVVRTTGYPTWTISKGVARMQAERAK